MNEEFEEHCSVLCFKNDSIEAPVTTLKVPAPGSHTGMGICMIIADIN
jgi:hypothetical protein